MRFSGLTNRQAVRQSRAGQLDIEGEEPWRRPTLSLGTVAAVALILGGCGGAAPASPSTPGHNVVMTSFAATGALGDSVPSERERSRPRIDDSEGWVPSTFFSGDPELDVGPPESGTNWGDMLAELSPDGEGIVCPGAACPTPAWQSVVEQGRSLALRDRVALVNRFVRQYDYFPDPEHQFGEDDWKTPERFHALGGGDCEDYAVAQYALLRAMGTPARFLRLVRVSEPGPLDHIALAVMFTDRLVVMDYDGLWGPERYGELIASMNEYRVWAHRDPFGDSPSQAAGQEAGGAFTSRPPG